MVKEINGKFISKSDLKKMMSIFDERMSTDYSELNSPVISNLPKELEKGENKYTIYLGDDWYFVLKRGLFSIELVEMIASVNVTMKRSIEMLNVLKKVFVKYKNCIILSDLRYDTTYRIISFLRNKNYIKVYYDRIYSIHPDLDKRDEMIEKAKYCRKIDDADYKYIMHCVSFRFKKDFKERKLC